MTDRTTPPGTSGAGKALYRAKTSCVTVTCNLSQELTRPTTAQATALRRAWPAFSLVPAGSLLRQFRYADRCRRSRPASEWSPAAVAARAKTLFTLAGAATIAFGR